MVRISFYRSVGPYLPLLFGLFTITAGCTSYLDHSPAIQEPMVLVVEKKVIETVEAKKPDTKLVLAKGEEKVDKLAEMDNVPPKTPVPSIRQPNKDRYPINLGAALQLAGGNNLQIGLAMARVEEAYARLKGAEVLWLPSINLGVGYNRHGGQIQDTTGAVRDIQRGSVFVGGGAGVGNAPLTGAANGPARLFVALPLADAIFAPLAQKQRVNAAHAAQSATFNEALFQVTLAYLNLVQAQGQVSIAEEAIQNGQRLLELIKKRVQAGQDLPADQYRAENALAVHQQMRHEAEEAVRVASTELVRLLRLDPAVVLFPVENMPVPIEMVPLSTPLSELIAQGVSQRPEVGEAEALIRASGEAHEQERWRPWIPNIHLGLSSGGFGGGRGAFIGNFSDRTDFDALAVWELQNLGLGNVARQRERASQVRQAHLSALRVRDIVSAQVARAYHQAMTRRKRIDAATEQVKSAAEAIPLNFKGILGGDLRAIEAQQAIGALSSSRIQYLSAILAYNRAQFSLLYSIGQIPPEAMPHPAEPMPEKVMPARVKPEPQIFPTSRTKPAEHDSRYSKIQVLPLKGYAGNKISLLKARK